MAEKIQNFNFDDGVKTYSFTFTGSGNKVKVSFNPTDKNLAIRCKKAGENINNYIKSLSDKEAKINSDGTPEDIELLDEFEKLTDMITKEVDEAFRSNIGSVVFAECNPLSCVNGDYFYMTFFEVISKILEDENAGQTEKANKNLEKHLGKYKKYMKKAR